MTWTNSAVYDKKVQQKQHAMQLTAQARQRARDQRQITKVISAVYGAAPQGHSSGKPTANVMRDIVVNDLRFRVALNGSKLVRIYGKQHEVPVNVCIDILDGPRVLAQETPKQVKVAGVTFYRSKSGNLHRSGLVKQQRCVLTPDRQQSLNTHSQGKISTRRAQNCVKHLHRLVNHSRHEPETATHDMLHYRSLLQHNY